MLISEIYMSRQGEGRLTGQESIFVRTSGCNLRCDFCDTPYTSWQPVGKPMTVDEIATAVRAYPVRHVVITGGEPMLHGDVIPLTHTLQEAGYHITIETAGTIFRQANCDLMSISPKLSNSTPAIERAGEWSRKHERTRINPSVVQQLIDAFDFQLKFVVIEPADIAEVQSFCQLLDNVHPERIQLMPEGVDQETLNARAGWLQSICQRYGYTFCPRKHIQWYGNRRGT